MEIAIALTILAVVALLLLGQWLVLRRARRAEGQPAPDTSAVDQGIDAPRRVYYFYSAHCGPCRAIAPLIDRLREEYPNLIKVDVPVHLELARDFGIAATPSFIVVVEGMVSEVKLGGVSEAWLREKLAPPP
jgi:thiol-disulfide isomerase/thioredoxin